MPAISIIMPVYNTEKYVGKAIESILNQSFTDYEFLIIDNGSTDGSGEIINHYAKIDSRIKVLRNEKNVFISEARNMAMEKLTGEYMYLIDSDDWVLPDMLETMYFKAKKYSAEYVVAGYYMDYYQRGRNLSYTVCPDDAFYTKEEFRNHAVDYLVRTILTVPWNKLYSLPYLRKHNIKFRNTKLEDHHFNMDIIKDVDRVCMISKPFYHYYRSRCGTDSQLVYNKYLNQKKREHFAHTLEVYKYWGINDEITMQKLADYHLGRLVQCITETVSNTNIDKSNCNKELEQIIKDDYTRFALKYSSGNSKKISILSIPIKMKSIFLCKIMGKTVAWFRSSFPALFSNMRADIAQNAERVR